MANLFSHARAALTAGALLFAPAAFADAPAQPEPDVAAPPVRAAPVTPPAETAAASIPDGRTGQIALMDGALTLNVPAGYRFYPSEQAYAYAQRTSSTLPKGTVLGLLAPANTRIDQPDAWATIVSYEPIGHVPAETSAGLTAPTFEADVRAARTADNRTFEGFAVAPAFETATPSLVWAERVQAPAAGGRDFRHEVRVLGRTGVASLTSLGSADQMPAITTAAPDMMGMLAFAEGNRYADFTPASDQVSTYTVPGLVTGVSSDAPAPQAVAASENSQGGFGGLQGMFPLIALGVVVLAGLGYVFMRRRPDPNINPDDA
jgi:uncharacterized membrane-anchored protein